VHYRGSVQEITETPLIVVSNLVAREPDFRERINECISILAVLPGCITVELGRSLDSETDYLLVSRWESVGKYRKALSNFDVKSIVIPFISLCITESMTAEVINRTDSKGSEHFESALAADAFTYERSSSQESSSTP
jgi:heme oxygenase (mycobilin-producing)